MSHTWMSHVAHMNESCRTHEWVMSHIWMSHVAHINESSLVSHVWMGLYWCHHWNRHWCRHLEWVMSHISMSHHWCHHWYHTYEWVSICVIIGTVIDVVIWNESCHTYEWVIISVIIGIAHMTKSLLASSLVSSLISSFGMCHFCCRPWNESPLVSCRTYEWVK